MSVLSRDLKDGLNIAVTEANLTGLAVDRPQARVSANHAVLTLAKDGIMPTDRRVILRFERVGRVCASLRDGA